jgi:ribosomal protein S18 acetylase RimI-like enzyme
MDPLEHPIWSALTTAHAPLAIAHGAARRYPYELARFAALEEPSAQAWRDLREIVAPGELVSMATTAPVELPPGWRILFGFGIDQMVFAGERPEPHTSHITLGDADAPEMLALAQRTDPGPFFERTHQLGRFIGIRAPDGTLAAMAGERMKLDGATEISAVCTDPAHQGRGYGRRLMETLLAEQLDRGELPFLHVKDDNPAKGLYERLGFRVSRAMRFTVFTNEGDEAHALQ